MNKRQRMEQFKKAIRLWAQTLDNDTAMEISSVYPKWKPNTAYKTGEYITFGENNVGDRQLYKVVQEHTSQANWTPDITVSLYDPIGLNENGYTTWSAPSGAHDAYNKGDIVDYNDTLYISLVDGNIYAPDIVPQNWELYEDDSMEAVLSGLI